MVYKKSKFKPGETVFATTHRVPGQSFLIRLIKYIPNYEWYAEFKDNDSNEVKCDYFDERNFT